MQNMILFQTLKEKTILSIHLKIRYKTTFKTSIRYDKIYKSNQIKWTQGDYTKHNTRKLK